VFDFPSKKYFINSEIQHQVWENSFVGFIEVKILLKSCNFQPFSNFQHLLKTIYQKASVKNAASNLITPILNQDLNQQEFRISQEFSLTDYLIET